MKFENKATKVILTTNDKLVIEQLSKDVRFRKIEKDTKEVKKVEETKTK